VELPDELPVVLLEEVSPETGESPGGPLIGEPVCSSTLPPQATKATPESRSIEENRIMVLLGQSTDRAEGDGEGSVRDR
jgi:hypothetical protein